MRLFIHLTWLPVPSATSHPCRGKPQEIILFIVILVLCAALPSCPSGCLPDLFHTSPRKHSSVSGHSRIGFKRLQPPKPLPGFPGYQPTRMSFWSLLSASKANQFGCQSEIHSLHFPYYPVSCTKQRKNQTKSSPQERIVSPCPLAL